MQFAPNIPLFAFCLHRRLDGLAPIAAKTTGVEANDKDLVARLIRSYRDAAQQQGDLGKSMWKAFFLERHQGIHQCFIEGRHQEATRILRDPGSSELMYGFDNLVASLRQPVTNIYENYFLFARWNSSPVLDDMVRLAEATGAFRLENPEHYQKRVQRQHTIEPILAALDNTFGFALQFPNPFPGEFGLHSSRGVISQRVPPAIYQAWRISQLVAGIPNPRVLEIGAGLGRTAYYARSFGIADYTIVDIPFTSLSQGYFLGRVLGEDAIALFGEKPDGLRPRIKILPPSSFLGASDRYDLVINADSLPEMDPNVAMAYWGEIEARSDAFLSINHEGHLFTVKQLIDGRTREAYVTRVPNWMREGYVEETVRFKPKRQGG